LPGFATVLLRIYIHVGLFRAIYTCEKCNESCLAGVAQIVYRVPRLLYRVKATVGLSLSN